ncbi:MAG: DNA polymerase III subunit alpha [Spirochaetes bacterium]|nr:DNA polymerase III subunit alpha [Spirochaetota bacterium]
MTKHGFVHLHNHTEYSLLDGMIKIKQMIAKAQQLGMSAVGMTDHGNLFGAIEFYKECKKSGIKPIIGSEYYMTAGSRQEKNDERFHLVLLAKSYKGYQNLIQLSSNAFIDGFYYKPRIDYELLEKYHDDLICLSACLAGEIPQLILKDQINEAEKKALYFKELFGAQSFFLELQMHGLKEEKKVVQELWNMSKKLKIPMAATNDAHYLNKEDAEAHDILLCINQKKTIADNKRLKFPNDQFYFKSEEEMLRIFDQLPRCLSNTQFIAEQCNIEIELPGPILPEFEVPQGYDKESYLKHITEEGIIQRYGEITPELRDRMDMELGVINRMHFPGYFLVVWDFIKYARDHNIWVGPGRGSGAGSIVAYALGITNINPLKYGLLFERFLNEERVSMPDFDIDFCKERRGEVIEYVNNKYSREKVSQIVTFSKMKAKAVIRDVGRALDIPLARVNQIVKMLPEENNLPKEIKDNAKSNGSLLLALTKNYPVKLNSEDQEKVNAYKTLLTSGTEDEKRLLETSIKLENLTRHTSVHAAGVVIGKEQITNYVPLQVVKDNKKGDMITTQFPGPQLEECGLVKMDFLGLITLTLLRDCLKLLANRGIEIDLDKLPLNDPKVFDLFSAGKTDAVFQFESPGMQKYLKKLQPTCLEDLIAMNALYRPGPMNFIDTYISRKHGEEKVEYDHELMKPILNETYGIMIYQEQVMQIAQILAGYTLGSADILRRAMGKKKEEEMIKHSKIFVDGAAQNNISADVAQTIFDKMKEFANYGFNKSHSAAYAYLAYQSAYLKAHYPVDFMTAVLTSEINHPDKLLFYINSCRDSDIEILQPDVNHSLIDFSVEDQKIRYGLCGIKGVGDSASANIIETRERCGAFKDFYHFLESIDLRVVNRAVLETLIKSGALDGFAGSRKWMIENLDDAINDAQEHQADLKAGQGNLFAEILETEEHQQIPDDIHEEWPEKEKLIMEKEILGFYLTGSPLQKYQSFIRHNCTHNSRTIKDITFNGNGYEVKRNIFICGIIDDARIFTTEDGSNWARLVVYDDYGNYEVNVYKNQFEQFGSLLQQHRILFLKTYCKMSNDRLQIVAESLEDIDIVNENTLSEFHIYLKQYVINKEDFESLKNDLITINGSLSLIFHIKDEFDNDIVMKVPEYKAPKDEVISNTLQEKYQFIQEIRMM